MYKREECERLADDIEKLIESLMSITSANGDITDQMKALCKEEIGKISNNTEGSLKDLREVINKHDKLLCEAIESSGSDAKAKWERVAHDTRATFGEGNQGLQMAANYGKMNNTLGKG